MSRPRTRSQGLPEGEEDEMDRQTMTQRRMLRELQVWLETLRLWPERQSEGGDPLTTQQQTPPRNRPNQRGQPV